MRTSNAVEQKGGEESIEPVLTETEDQILAAAEDELGKAKADLQALKRSMEELAAKRADIEKQAVEANHTIEETEPLLAAATGTSLPVIELAHLTEVRQLKNPGLAIQRVVAAMMILLQKPTDWDTAMAEIASNPNLTPGKEWYSSY